MSKANLPSGVKYYPPAMAGDREHAVQNDRAYLFTLDRQRRVCEYARPEDKRIIELAYRAANKLFYGTKNIVGVQFAGVFPYLLEHEHVYNIIVKEKDGNNTIYGISMQEASFQDVIAYVAEQDK